MADKNKLKMGVEVNIGVNSAQKGQRPASQAVNLPSADANTPFCIAVMGDFSGVPREPLAKLRAIEIDRDNFEARMAAFKIQLNVNINGESIPLAIKAPEDFHPDELYQKLESFSQLRSLRRRLKNNKTFADAAAEMQGWVPDAVENTPAAHTTSSGADDKPVDNEAEGQDTENLLDSILDAHTPASSTASTEAGQIERLIRSIVAPYVEPAADPRQDEMIALVDQATQTHMRDILHNAEFQAMEAAWLSLWFLVKRVETGSRLKIKILDISKQALADDLARDELSASAMYKFFCDPSEGDIPWGVLSGNYTFGTTIEDILTLASVGAIAQQAGAPFISAAAESLVGCESFATAPDYDDWHQPLTEGVKKAWQMLRESPVAASIGLALPRFMLRLPYGKKSSPVESFSFEELDEVHRHSSYLWGNAAFLKVECMAQNFNRSGWDMHLESVYQTDDLPVHYYKEAGETLSKPVAEIMLTEKGGGMISQQGLIPIWSVKNADAVRSSDYRSLAMNAEKLRGRWA
ncbi:Uncharacterized protein ImpC [hydrothermal vent metagenome]|uniref:Uncharacterized protein ImpC n=1 Tax=hydrothermal vent metagenome TaxID=652676 RepID=A0A3B0XX00_9ZZZZ